MSRWRSSATHVTRTPQRRAAPAALALLLALASAAAGCARHSDHHARHHGFTGDTGPIQVVTTQVGGKNVFIPSTLVITSGAPHTLSIFNTTEIPHGFRIPAIGIEEILQPQTEQTVELPALEGHQVLRIDCHLHPPHRTATLVVLPRRQ